MNVQERDQLLQFFSSLRQAPRQPKDPVAEELIRHALADGVSPYDLVQRTMALSLALQAAQARVAELQARCEQQARDSARPAPALSTEPMSTAFQEPVPQASPSVWSQGLLRQVTGTALGVAAGVVAGGLLLEGWQRVLAGDSAAVPGGLADAGAGLWEGDDWA